MKKVFLTLACAGIIMVSMTSCKKECECTIKMDGAPADIKMDAGKLSKKDCEDTKAIGTYTEGSGVSITCGVK